MGGSLGGLGSPCGGVPGAPTHRPQNDPVVALILLKTHVGGLKKKFTRWGSSPGSQIFGEEGGGWGGEARGEESSLFDMYI